jgi:hypothetical protein
MAKVLTSAVEKYIGGDKRREIADAKASGLYLVIQPSGQKSWALRFRRPERATGKINFGPRRF